MDHRSSELAATGPLGNGLRLIDTNGLTLVSLERPTKAEIDTLLRKFPVDRADLDTALDRAAPPSLWRRDLYTAITLPALFVTPERSAARVSGSPVTLLMGDRFLVVIHTGEIRPLSRWIHQLETGERPREDRLIAGTEVLAARIVLDLLDAGLAVHTLIEREIASVEDAVLSGEGPFEAALPPLLRLRSNLRQARRLIAPWPSLLRTIAATSAEWDHPVARSSRLIDMFDDDLEATNDLFLAASTRSSSRQTHFLRILTVVAALTLPVLTIASLLALPFANPFTGPANGYAMALAIAGGTLLAALAGLRHSRIWR